MVNYDMNNDNKFFALSNNGFSTMVLPHCAECPSVDRRFAPIEIEHRGYYSDPSSGVFRLEVGHNFLKPRRKGYNLLMFELTEFSKQQKKSLYCKAA